MKKPFNFIMGVLIRYLILIIIALPNLWIFYTFFGPLTIYPVYWLLSLFFSVSLVLVGNFILVGGFPIEIINACIAGSAYYLLLIFNLSIPNIKFSKRIKMILFAFGVFLIVNILRIFLLSIMAVSGSSFFNITHLLFWYFISIIFVIGIWFIEVRIFNIKEIPFYSDLKYLYRRSVLKE